MGIVISEGIASRCSDEGTKMRANPSKSQSPVKNPAEHVVKEIRRATRRHFWAEDKIRIVEQSHLPVLKTLELLGVPRRTFCRWYDGYLDGGPEALADRSPAPSRVWNRNPAPVHDHSIELALIGDPACLDSLAAKLSSSPVFDYAANRSISDCGASPAIGRVLFAP